MKPYRPEYLWRAGYLVESADREILEYIDRCEESNPGAFTPEMAKQIKALDEACEKADSHYSLMWDRWLSEEAHFHKLVKINPELTIFKYYELGLNEKAEMHECNNPTFS